MKGKAVYVCPWCMKVFPIDTFPDDELPLCDLCKTAILQRRTEYKVSNQ